MWYYRYSQAFAAQCVCNLLLSLCRSYMATFTGIRLSLRTRDAALSPARRPEYSHDLEVETLLFWGGFYLRFHKLLSSFTNFVPCSKTLPAARIPRHIVSLTPLPYSGPCDFHVYENGHSKTNSVVEHWIIRIWLLYPSSVILFFFFPLNLQCFKGFWTPVAWQCSQTVLYFSAIA